MKPSQKLAVIFLLTLLTGLSAPAWAQLFGKPHTTAEILLAQTQVTPGSEVQGAFHLTMSEHWHTYWKYPGEVGLPTEAKWELPPGWQVSTFEWPTPQMLDTAGLVSYAYDGEVYFPFTVKVPEQAKAGEKVTLKVKLSWLECKEACVPGEAHLEVTVPVAESAQESAQTVLDQLAGAQSRIPKMRDDIQVTSREGKFFISLPAELQGDKVSFFPDSKDQIQEKLPQTVEPEGDHRVLVVPAGEKTTSLSGVLSDGEHGLAFEASVKKSAAPVQAAALGTVLFTAAAAFLGGLVLNLMPCVFPVLSLKVLGIVEQSNSEGRPAWHHGLVFAAGVLVSFWVMSGVLLVVRAAGEGVGWGYQLQNPFMVAGLAVLFLLIGLNLFGVFEVGENLTAIGGVAEKKEGFAHSFWSGVLTTLAATPCTAPFMGGAVGFALSQPNWVAILIFSALALGVAAPYLTLTCFPALLRLLPKPGAWMITFKQILAFPMLLAVVWLSWVFGSQMGTDRMALLLLALVGVGLASWTYGRWGMSFEAGVKVRGMAAGALILGLSLYTVYRAGTPPLGEELWLDYSPELVTRLKAEGKPFFLDFTADWCTSCKANELVALSRSEVLERFQQLNVTLVKADWTKRDDVIAAKLAEYGRAGVPLYVLYPGGDAKPVLLPEVLLPGTVLSALDGLEKKRE